MKKLKTTKLVLSALTVKNLSAVRGGDQVVTVPDATFVYSCDNPWSCGYSTVTVCTNRPGR